MVSRASDILHRKMLQSLRGSAHAPETKRTHLFKRKARKASRQKRLAQAGRGPLEDSFWERVRGKMADDGVESVSQTQTLFILLEVRQAAGPWALGACRRLLAKAMHEWGWVE